MGSPCCISTQLHLSFETALHVHIWASSCAGQLSLQIQHALIVLPARLHAQIFIFVSLNCKAAHILLQFEWAAYKAEMTGLAAMTGEGVVAMLRRNSTMLSMCVYGSTRQCTSMLNCQLSLNVAL